jgi:hypothetical protein
MVQYAQGKEATLISKKDDQLESDMGQLMLLFSSLLGAVVLVFSSVGFCKYKLGSFPLLLLCWVQWIIL